MLMLLLLCLPLMPRSLFLLVPARHPRPLLLRPKIRTPSPPLTQHACPPLILGMSEGLRDAFLHPLVCPCQMLTSCIFFHLLCQGQRR